MPPHVPMVRGIIPCRGIRLSSSPSRPPYSECEMRRSWSSREALMVRGPSGLPGASWGKRAEAREDEFTYIPSALRLIATISPVDSDGGRKGRNPRHGREAAKTAARKKSGCADRR